MVSLPVSIPLDALLPSVDMEDKEQGKDQRQDGQAQPEDNQPGDKQFFGHNIVSSY